MSYFNYRCCIINNFNRYVLTESSLPLSVYVCICDIGIQNNIITMKSLILAQDER